MCNCDCRDLRVRIRTWLQPQGRPTYVLTPSLSNGSVERQYPIAKLDPKSLYLPQHGGSFLGRRAVSAHTASFAKRKFRTFTEGCLFPTSLTTFVSSKYLIALFEPVLCCASRTEHFPTVASPPKTHASAVVPVLQPAILHPLPANQA